MRAPGDLLPHSNNPSHGEPANGDLFLTAWGAARILGSTATHLSWGDTTRASAPGPGVNPTPPCYQHCHQHNAAYRSNSLRHTPSGHAVNQSGKQPLILCKLVFWDQSNFWFTGLNSEVIFFLLFLHATLIFWKVFRKYTLHQNVLPRGWEKKTEELLKHLNVLFSYNQLLHTHFKFSACKNTIACQKHYGISFQGMWWLNLMFTSSYRDPLIL